MPFSALWLPLFDELADPAAVARLAADAEAAGRDGVFVLPELDPGTVSLDQVRGVLRDGPLDR